MGELFCSFLLHIHIAIRTKMKWVHTYKHHETLTQKTWNAISIRSWRHQKLSTSLQNKGVESIKRGFIQMAEAHCDRVKGGLHQGGSRGPGGYGPGHQCKARKKANGGSESRDKNQTRNQSKKVGQAEPSQSKKTQAAALQHKNPSNRRDRGKEGRSFEEPPGGDSGHKTRGGGGEPRGKRCGQAP